jgi:hypothetical protein
LFGTHIGNKQRISTNCMKSRNIFFHHLWRWALLNHTWLVLHFPPENPTH